MDAISHMVLTLRSLSKQNLSLARLEMTWSRRGYAQKWAEAANEGDLPTQREAQGRGTRR